MCFLRLEQLIVNKIGLPNAQFTIPSIAIKIVKIKFKNDMRYQTYLDVGIEGKAIAIDENIS